MGYDPTSAWAIIAYTHLFLMLLFGGLKAVPPPDPPAMVCETTVRTGEQVIISMCGKETIIQRP